MNITVNPPANLPPIARNDQAQTVRDLAITIPVLTNDTDPEDELDSGSVTITSAATHGTATPLAGGSIRYTPTAGYDGSDSFSYQVCDSGSPVKCDTAIVSITVNPPANQPPNAVNDNAVTQRDQAVTISVLNNDSDPEGALNSSSVTITSAPNHGTTTPQADGKIRYTPAAGYDGSDSFSYQVCDSGSPVKCDTAVVNITVNAPLNQPPNAVNDNAVTQRDQAVTISVLNNDSDPEGALNSGSVTITSAATHGTTTPQVDGKIRYTPAAGYDGNDSFSYQVCDSGSPVKCDTAVVSITVNAPLNQPPNAVNDNAVTQRDQVVTISVLNNDSDPEGALNSGSVTITSAATHGTTTPQVDGKIRYTPAAGYDGSDSFSYQVCDSGSPVKCDTATVSITVNAPLNQPPNAVNDNAVTQRDQAVTISVLNNDSDPEGALNSSSVTITSAPNHGTTTPQADGKIRYTPAAGYDGSDSFSYQVCDSGSPVKCDTATVSITVNAPLNQPPNAVNDNAVTQRDQAVTISVLNNDSDPEGALNSSSVTITSAPNHGTTTPQVDGKIRYTPAAGYDGNDSFSYQVCDSGSPVKCDTAVVNVTVNIPAVGNSILVVDDQVDTVQETAVNGDVLANDSDPEGDPFAPPTVDAAPGNGSLTLRIDGRFTYTPSLGFIGNDSWQYQLCDQGLPVAACATATVSVTVTAAPNQSPIATADLAEIEKNQVAQIAVLDNDTDPDGSLNIASLAVTNPAGQGQAVVVGDKIEYTPIVDYVGMDTFDYLICDDATPAACTPATVSISVRTPANQPPNAVNDVAATESGRAVSIPVLENDVDTDSGLDIASLEITTEPTSGQTEIVNDRVIYTPTASFTGNLFFEYRVCDSADGSACSTATVTITVTAGNNMAPFAVDDIAFAGVNGSVSIQVLINDVDLDGLIDASSLTITTPPTDGQASVKFGGPDTVIHYTPTLNFAGSDQFTYQICDDAIPPACSSADVQVNVQPTTNQPPIAVDDNAFTTAEQAVLVQVSANDVDPEKRLDHASLTLLVPPASGEATTINGSIVYTPTAGFLGNVDFSYQICDSETPALCDSAAVRITVVAETDQNLAYAFNDAAYVRAGESTDGNVLANDLDPEADGWQAPTISIPPIHGTVTLEADGRFTYRANADFVGDDLWIYEVCDLGATPACASATVIVTIVDANQGPLAGDDYFHIAVNSLLSASLINNDLDPDGADIIVSEQTTVAPEHGIAALAGDGNFTYRPENDFAGPDRFSYQVCDIDNRCSTAWVYIDVRAEGMANMAPYLGDDRAIAGSGQSVRINVLANDSDLDGTLDVATVSITQAPDQGIATVNADGTFTYLPPPGFSGETSFSYRACDNGAPILCATAVVNVVVMAAPEVNQTYAFADIVRGRTNTTFMGNVLENDFDPEGDMRIVTTAPLTPPQFGTLLLSSDGAFVYTPQSGFIGRDRFEYQVCDKGLPQACDQAEVLVLIFPTNLGWDFGDAQGYRTQLIADGPRHAIIEGLSLGSLVDAEAEAASNIRADGDDTTNLNDEDIVLATPAYDNSGEYQLQIPVTNSSPFAAQLVGWIDWNTDFEFTGPGERSLAAVQVQSAQAGAQDEQFATANIPAFFTGEVTLTWRDFDVTGSPSLTKYVRLRLAADLPGSSQFFSEAGPRADGAAIGGSVVDLLAPIKTEPVVIESPVAEREGAVVNVSWATRFETGIAGYFIVSDNDGGFGRVNSEMTPALGSATSTATDYHVAAESSGLAFYIEIVLDNGESYLHGPFYPTGTFQAFLPYLVGPSRPGGSVINQTLTFHNYLPLVALRTHP